MCSQHKRPEPTPPPPRRKRSSLPWIGVVAGVAVVVGGAFAWGFLRPQRTEVKVDPNDPAMVRLMDESLMLEHAFARICDNHTPTEADLQQLQRAIDNQREWMRATGNTGAEQEQRLQNLESLYESAWQRSAVARSLADEAAGRASLAAGKQDEGLARLNSALDLQRQLNQRQGPGSGRDLPRETTLAQEIERLGAEPLGAELATVTVVAARLRDGNKTAEALAAYTRAHELQLRLNREFGRTQLSSISNLDKIEEEIATLDSAGLMADIMAFSAQAAQAQADGRSAEAVALLEKAAAAQRKINADFPRSRNVSTERVDTLEVARQTELSAEPMRRVLQLDREIVASLRARQLDGVPEKLKEGAELNDEVAARLPRSRRLDPDLRLKFNYLLLHRETLGPVLKMTADGLRALPGRETLILGTEVPQRLFEPIMQANPSRQSGADLPVESVSALDAAEFCRRLSWMLGRTVRLPTETEYRSALGSVPAGAALSAQVWSLERSGQRPHQVASSAPGANGCSDLLGNVAEWLAPAAADAEMTLVAGGSYADPEAVLAKVPMEKRNRLDRSRTIGFRVVVE
jgi:hypothetical protein